MVMKWDKVESWAKPMPSTSSLRDKENMHGTEQGMVDHARQVAFAIVCDWKCYCHKYFQNKLHNS